MSTYRLEQGLRRFSIVGTTVKNPEPLPQDRVADEKHSGLHLGDISRSASLSD